MKGVIFAELIKWVEETRSPEVADAMILQAGCKRDGVYTSVGNYPYEDAIALLTALSGISGTDGAELAYSYGVWLAPRFAQLYPEIFEGYSDLRTFLRDIDAHHHMEVKKLYPDAKTPSVVAVFEGEEIGISYASHRPFAGVAHGLIEGYARHFGEQVEIERVDTEGKDSIARFAIRSLAPKEQAD